MPKYMGSCVMPHGVSSKIPQDHLLPRGPHKGAALNCHKSKDSTTERLHHKWVKPFFWITHKEKSIPPQKDELSILGFHSHLW